MASADSDRAMKGEFRLRGNPWSMASVTRGNFTVRRIFTLAARGSADRVGRRPRLSVEGLGRRDERRRGGGARPFTKRLKARAPELAGLTHPPLPAISAASAIDARNRRLGARSRVSGHGKRKRFRWCSEFLSQRGEVWKSSTVSPWCEDFAGSPRGRDPHRRRRPCASAVLSGGTPPAPRERTAS